MSMPTAPFSGGAWPVRTVASVPVHGLYGPLLTMFGVDGNLVRYNVCQRFLKQFSGGVDTTDSGSKLKKFRCSVGC